jgi:hypothetical protein
MLITYFIFIFQYHPISINSFEVQQLLSTESSTNLNLFSLFPATCFLPLIMILSI